MPRKNDVLLEEVRTISFYANGVRTIKRNTKINAALAHLGPLSLSFMVQKGDDHTFNPVQLGEDGGESYQQHIHIRPSKETQETALTNHLVRQLYDQKLNGVLEDDGSPSYLLSEGADERWPSPVMAQVASNYKEIFGTNVQIEHLDSCQYDSTFEDNIDSTTDVEPKYTDTPIEYLYQNGDTDGQQTSTENFYPPNGMELTTPTSSDYPKEWQQSMSDENQLHDQSGILDQSGIFTENDQSNILNQNGTENEQKSIHDKDTMSITLPSTRKCSCKILDPGNYQELPCSRVSAFGKKKIEKRANSVPVIPVNCDSPSKGNKLKSLKSKPPNPLENAYDSSYVSDRLSSHPSKLEPLRNASSSPTANWSTESINASLCNQSEHVKCPKCESCIDVPMTIPVKAPRAYDESIDVSECNIREAKMRKRAHTKLLTSLKTRRLNTPTLFYKKMKSDLENLDKITHSAEKAVDKVKVRYHNYMTRINEKEASRNAFIEEHGTVKALASLRENIDIQKARQKIEEEEKQKALERQKRLEEKDKNLPKERRRISVCELSNSILKFNQTRQDALDKKKNEFEQSLQEALKADDSKDQKAVVKITRSDKDTKQSQHQRRASLKAEQDEKWDSATNLISLGQALGISVQTITEIKIEFLRWKSQEHNIFADEEKDNGILPFEIWREKVKKFHNRGDNDIERLETKYFYHSREMDFAGFVLFYNSEDFFVADKNGDKDDKLRSLADYYCMPLADVQTVLREFEKIDTNQNGVVDMDEFMDLTSMMLSVPKEHLPGDRFNRMWQEIDKGGRGEATFDDFLEWYRRYLYDPSGTQNRLDLFYANFYNRRITTL